MGGFQKRSKRSGGGKFLPERLVGDHKKVLNENVGCFKIFDRKKNYYHHKSKLFTRPWWDMHL